MYLAELRSRTEPIRVGVVGVGRMGRGVVDQVSTMAGMRLMAAADVDLGRAGGLPARERLRPHRD